MTMIKDKTTTEILIEARKLIEREENWTQEAFARQANGNNAYLHGPFACKFCTIGAVRRVTSDELTTKEKALDALRSVAQVPLAIFNDAHTHAEVLQLFDKAIKLSKTTP